MKIEIRKGTLQSLDWPHKGCLNKGTSYSRVTMNQEDMHTFTDHKNGGTDITDGLINRPYAISSLGTLAAETRGRCGEGGTQ